jgi:putative FmdB family regulatory protein
VPRYKYKCGNCAVELEIFHTLKEEVTDCTECEAKNTLERTLSKPFISKNKKKKKNDIGDITKKFIEENREVLAKQKEETKNRTYDKT